MELKEIKPTKNDKYLVEFEGREMNNYEALDIIKTNAKIIYFSKGQHPTFKDLRVKDNLNKIYDDDTIIIGVFDVIVKNNDYYNMFVIVESIIGLKSIMVGLIDRPTIKRNEDGKITDIIL